MKMTLHMGVVWVRDYIYRARIVGCAEVKTSLESDDNCCTVALTIVSAIGRPLSQFQEGTRTQ